MKTLRQLLYLCLLLLSPLYGRAASFGPNSAVFTNPYKPWNLGAEFVLVGTGDATGISLRYRCLAVENIRGVSCLKVETLDVGRANLRTYDWLAQDTAGNIWKLQKSDEQFDGSWWTQSGQWLDTPASIALGESVEMDGPDSYIYSVVSVTGTASTPYRTFTSCVVLELSEFGDVEQYFIAPGFGPVLATFTGSENGSFALQSVSGFQPPAEVVLPDVHIQVEGANAVRISWGATEHDVELVFSTSLTNSWTAVSNTPSADGDGWFVQLPVQPGNRFFRLRKRN